MRVKGRELILIFSWANHGDFGNHHDLAFGGLQFLEFVGLRVADTFEGVRYFGAILP